MDVDTNEGRRAQDKSLLDTTFEEPQLPVTQSDNYDAPATCAPVAIYPPTTILDRPREVDGTLQPLSTQNVHTSQRSDLSRNLIHVFNLDSLAATVARTDPVTGEKINKMRKSYEGQLKALQLTGKNKAVQHEDAKFGMGLFEMSAWPEEEWQRQKVHGKEVQKGLPESIGLKLEKAMQMQPGQVPQNNEWEDLLGIEKVKQSDPITKTAKLTNTSKTENPPNGMRPIITKAQDADVIRPKRTAKKRRYDEGSFEGYGEGYVDDEMDLGGGGYTSGETHGSRNSATKKRRKTKDYGNSPTGFGDRGFGAAPMGISAYGR